MTGTVKGITFQSNLKQTAKTKRNNFQHRRKVTTTETEYKSAKVDVLVQKAVKVCTSIVNRKLRKPKRHKEERVTFYIFKREA